MGNTNSNKILSSSINDITSNLQSTVINDCVRISTDHPDGFYFSGSSIIGTVEIPNTLMNTNNRAISCVNKLNRTKLLIELVGNAVYSAEVDTGADSDGHALHDVNVCRRQYMVVLESNQQEEETNLDTTIENCTSIINNGNDNNHDSVQQMITGKFTVDIPDYLPPSLNQQNYPHIVYYLELILLGNSGSNWRGTDLRYQIPLIISSLGPRIPSVIDRNDLFRSNVNRHDIQVSVNLTYSYFHPGDSIPIRVAYKNPQRRHIRSINLQLMQYFLVANDIGEKCLEGKEWIFDTDANTSWSGNEQLHLPDNYTPASYLKTTVGTTTLIQCEVGYHIVVVLKEKGLLSEDIRVIVPIEVTYQKS
ncbi:unnamed protein product [Didymodactylos carnosus]|uniref:Arrestin C-terminal-like domain-containing protein n=1 Tax=Didymodactylos carnosus TaxID=1234261 RepID=A0A814B1B8_9BILA|nr:unnamed protein product [Didymodactylos carnosus]CAF0922908.1 unnamed protein product [Didymodactylos carnosus]CAF3689412.1 unnamed protein product [Didymodactylos carnosus]CAF3701956.1 unnamed protein product [Didymodactylos carnosus]